MGNAATKAPNSDTTNKQEPINTDTNSSKSTQTPPPNPHHNHVNPKHNHLNSTTEIPSECPMHQSKSGSQPKPATPSPQSSSPPDGCPMKNENSDINPNNMVNLTNYSPMKHNWFKLFLKQKDACTKSIASAWTTISIID